MASPSEHRPYHHGDLRRALVEAAMGLLESDGPTALSLRAVARRIGVSPAAPYHHFRDKADLLGAVAEEGWARLDAILQRAREQAGDGGARTKGLGVVAYVVFALAHPALYRVMFDHARRLDELPAQLNSPRQWPYAERRRPVDAKPRLHLELQLATAAAWSAAHGLAGMADFRQFDYLKQSLGGQTPFVAAVLDQMGLFATARTD